jgi:enoyl-CoA hydratase
MAIVSTLPQLESAHDIMNNPLLFTRRDAVAIIAINDAPRNRMTLEFIDELEQRVEEIAADDSVRAVVLTAEGQENFSVGMNLKQLPEGIERAGGPEALFDQRLRVIAAIENMGKPWVVTLFGYCLGGGLEVPLGCHFRLAAAEGAQIGLPEMDLGSVPAWGGSARLSKCIGRDKTLEMILRGRKLSGPEALAIGLVHEVWPLAELKDRAIALAEELAAQPALAVRGVMQVAVGSEDRTLGELLQAERAAVTNTMGTPDQVEGMMAFLEKRKPVFNKG